MWKAAWCVLLLTAVGGLLSCKDESPKRTKIAVVPKGMTHEFWLSVKAGAMRAGKTLDVEVVWRGPETEDDRDAQIAIVRDLLDEGVDGIVLAPLDRQALIPPVIEAKARKVPVVVIDSALDSEDIVSHVSTDNRKAGELAGRETARLLGGKGTAIMLRYQALSASTERRESGWKKAVGKHAGIRILSDTIYAGATRASAQQASRELLDSFTENGTLTVDAVFCPNEPTAYGMLTVLGERGQAGQVKLIAIDASEALVRGLQAEHVHALVLQNPERIGYEGVKAMANHLRGKPVSPKVYTGVRLIGKADLSDDSLREWLPSLDRWRGGSGG